MRLKDKVAIVTGSGTGIGKAIALAFAREGAHLSLASRSLSHLEETAQEIRALGRKAIAISTDVSNEGQIKAMVSKTVAEFKRVDILVNNAGIVGPTIPVVDLTLEEWNRVLAVNLTGPMLCSREVLKHMIPQNSGVIIHVASNAIRRAHPGRSPYGASKRGLYALCQSMAMEVGKYSIRVNAICPGNTEGDLIEGLLRDVAKSSGRTYEEVRHDWATSAMGRFVTPEEVAALAVFLASDESSGMTGQAVDVSAGRDVGGLRGPRV
ncbi:MAG: SDR family oxidoreductase [Chloroflexi bacterium]|nr:SDR family oxidoreductase [Chloroflexota bacterium]